MSNFENWESKKSIQGEEEFASNFRRTYPSVIIEKNTSYFSIDFTVLNQSDTVLEFIEFKNFWSWGYQDLISKFGNVKISLRKWNYMMNVVERNLIPVRLMFKFKDMDNHLFVNVNSKNDRQLNLGFMKAKNNPNANEPVVKLIPDMFLMERF